MYWFISLSWPLIKSHFGSCAIYFHRSAYETVCSGSSDWDTPAQIHWKSKNQTKNRVRRRLPLESKTRMVEASWSCFYLRIMRTGPSLFHSFLANICVSFSLGCIPICFSFFFIFLGFTRQDVPFFHFFQHLVYQKTQQKPTSPQPSFAGFYGFSPCRSPRSPGLWTAGNSWSLGPIDHLHRSLNLQDLAGPTPKNTTAEMGNETTSATHFFYENIWTPNKFEPFYECLTYQMYFDGSISDDCNLEKHSPNLFNRFSRLKPECK